MSKKFIGLIKSITPNTKRFTGRYADREASDFISYRKREGEWWEFVENSHDRAVIMRRRNLE